MHNIVHDKSKKALIATLSGNIGVEQANSMLTDFKQSISNLNTKEHILIINPVNISASIFVLPILQSFIQLIGQLSFKRIYLINTDKYAAMIKQSLGGYGLADNINYADNISDALNHK